MYKPRHAYAAGVTILPPPVLDQELARRNTSAIPRSGRAPSTSAPACVAEDPHTPAASAAPAPEEAVTTSLGDQDKDPLDRERLDLLRQLGPADGLGLLPAVVGAFLEDAPSSLAALQRAVLSGGGQPLAEAAHRLKGSAANIGAPDVAALCHLLEAADGSDSETTSELMKQLETELDLAGRALAATLAVSE